VKGGRGGERLYRSRGIIPYVSCDHSPVTNHFGGKVKESYSIYMALFCNVIVMNKNQLQKSPASVFAALLLIFASFFALASRKPG